MYCVRTTPRYSMDYWADLPVKESCSILELTTRTAGRLRVVPLFSDARRKRRGEDETGTSRRTGRMGEDFERKKEDGEDGNWIQRENENQAF